MKHAARFSRTCGVKHWHFMHIVLELTSHGWFPSDTSMALLWISYSCFTHLLTTQNNNFGWMVVHHFVWGPNKITHCLSVLCNAWTWSTWPWSQSRGNCMTHTPEPGRCRHSPMQATVETTERMIELSACMQLLKISIFYYIIVFDLIISTS